MTVKESVFDNHGHRIGELKLIEKKGHIYYKLSLNGKYRHHFVSMTPESLKQGICGYTPMPRQGDLIFRIIQLNLNIHNIIA